MAARAAAIALLATIAAVTAAPLAHRAASTTATATPVGTHPVGMVPPLARHRRGAEFVIDGYNGNKNDWHYATIKEVNPIPTCAGHPATYDAGYGSCSTYAWGHKSQNFPFCAQDINTAGEVAENVCRECGACDDGRRVFTWENRAGVKWTLTQLGGTRASNDFDVGTDCPYYATGYTVATAKFDNSGNMVAITGPGGYQYTIGSCKDTSPSKDTSPWCPTWQRAGYCAHAAYKPWMATNCRSACGLCDKRNVPFTCTKDHGIQYGSKAINAHKHTGSYEGCMKKCELNHKCTYFTYSPQYGHGASDCWLKDDTIAKAEGNSFRKKNSKATSGKCTRTVSSVL